MEGARRVLEVWGIPIRIHPSWLLIFALITWSLAAGYFPAEYPGWSLLAYWAIGALTALVFFGSILLHELGHSWVALRNGLPIRGITLFIFGGVAQIAREPAAPWVELRIAIAGPVTSMGLAALFGVLWLGTREIPLLAAPAIWLARINFMVAGFNLIPGFPLDGGRVFRALVWRWTGSFQRATQAAAAAGELVAFAFIGFGVLRIVGGDVLGGGWMALIGWFLQSAAASSRMQASLRELLRGVTVGQLMTRECPGVTGGRTLEQIVQEEVLGAGRRCFFVLDDGNLRGVLTLHEVKAVPRERWGAVRAEEVMTPLERVTAVGPGEDLLSAIERMDDANVAQMPVLAGDRLLGMIGREQILHYVRVRGELGL
jgi:Zn-dependent protease/CBS domain-containing protein